MKKWIWLGLAGVVLLWLLGAAAMLPAVQTKLETAAKLELSKPEYTGAFDQVQVAFSGQDATLTGKVGSQREHAQLTTIIAESVRTPGSSLNPVSSVINRAGVAYELSRQHPKPWLLVARYGGKQGVIAGVVAPDLKDKAVKAVEARLADVKFISSVNARLGSDSKPRPAPDAATTLDAKVLPQLADGEIAVSPLDGRWTTFKASNEDIEISNALAGAESSDVIEALAPLRAMQAVEAEKVRQTTLPPSYGAVAALPDSLHIFGLTGDAESQRGLLTALSNAYPKRKILTSSIKTSNDIRAAAEWAPLVASLPNKDGEAFIAAIKATDTPAGRSATFVGKGDQAAMQKALVGVLPATFDFGSLWEPYGSWLKAKEAPPAPKVLPPAPPPSPSQPSIKIAPPAVPAPATPPAAAPGVTPTPPPPAKPPVTIVPSPAPATPPAVAPPVIITPSPAPVPAPTAPPAKSTPPQ